MPSLDPLSLVVGIVIALVLRKIFIYAGKRLDEYEPRHLYPHKAATTETYKREGNLVRVGHKRPLSPEADLDPASIIKARKRGEQKSARRIK